MEKIITRFVENERCVDIEQNFGGIWAVIRCSCETAPRPKPISRKKIITEEEKAARKELRQREKSAKFPNRISGSGVYNKYGLTEKDYEAIKELQGGKCLICGRGGRLVVDHDHESGEVRGLLCSNCNTGLGMFKDSVQSLQNAILYLSGGG